MKKIYKNPELKVVKIKTAPLMAGSPTQQMGFGESVETATGAEARRFRSLWDDDEDFE
jgi:hypothetical protein